MVARIVLPVGTEFIRLVEVPRLIADAIEQDAPNTGPVHRTLNCFTKSTRADAAGATLKNFSLDFDDYEKLKKVWLDAGLLLPAPTTEEKLRPYIEAANNSTAIKWELGVVWLDAPKVATIHRVFSEAEHKRDIELAIRERRLIAVWPHSRRAVDEWNETAIVSVQELSQYVKEFRIEVQLSNNLVIRSNTLPQPKQKIANEWVTDAQSRAREIIKEQRAKDLYPDQLGIADQIAKEFRAAGRVGADGKPISGAYIKRHALKGITSAIGKQLSTTKRQSK